MLVSPLRDEGSTFDQSGGRVCAAVFLSEPEQGPLLPETVLARLFSLTPAEARLAAALGEGRRLEDFAEETGVSRDTARSQLKAVFGKTGTHRQAELVRLLLTSPAALASGD